MPKPMLCVCFGHINNLDIGIFMNSFDINKVKKTNKKGVFVVLEFWALLTTYSTRLLIRPDRQN